jgi:undecaprenyl-diphosphatase
VDWRLFHHLNGALAHRDGAQDVAQAFNKWAIFVLVLIAGAIWFFGRPGRSDRSKLAAVSAALAAVVALIGNVVLGSIWFHDRPFVDHPRQTLLLVKHGADNSFPSDHTSVAFAVAFAVLVFHRRLGALLVLLAAAVGIDRIFVGVHYPVDVLAGMLVGLGAALLVAYPGRRTVAWLALQFSRLSDPVVSAVRQRVLAR